MVTFSAIDFCEFNFYHVALTKNHNLVMLVFYGVLYRFLKLVIL